MKSKVRRIRVPDFKVIEAGSYDELALDIQGHLRGGWEIVGDIFAHHDDFFRSYEVLLKRYKKKGENQ